MISQDDDLLYQLLIPEVREVADATKAQETLSDLGKLEHVMTKNLCKMRSKTFLKKLRRNEERKHNAKAWYSSMSLQSLLLQTLAQSRKKVMLQVRLEKNIMWVYGTLTTIDNETNTAHLVGVTETKMDNTGNVISYLQAPFYVVSLASINQVELDDVDCEIPPLEQIRLHIQSFETKRLVRGDVDRFYREDERFKQWLREGGDPDKLK
eukprot:GDKJ01037436.1.p1 GENE.GDKJ01037436.1~~GDKJ01037436.1.p1  ORF type:complete len:209 (+),score=30.24 GDKJ01037436.1:49-675(+)